MTISIFEAVLVRIDQDQPSLTTALCRFQGHDQGWLLNRSSPAVVELLKETRWAWPPRYARVYPHATEMALDGLLGGWNGGKPGDRPPTNGPDKTQDVATRDPATGNIAINAGLLYSRIDGSVASGITPMINLQVSLV